MDEKNRQRGKINNTELRKRPAGSFRAFREDQREMQQQSRHQHLRQDFDPIDFVIEGVQLSAVVEREENKRHEAENIEVHGARRVPAARKNEKADEEIDQANNAGVILDGGWFFGRSSYERSLKLLAVPGQSVAHLRPQPRAPQPLGDLDLPRDGGAIDGQDMIPGAHPGAESGRIGSHLLSLDTLRSVKPNDAVIGSLEFGSLD